MKRIDLKLKSGDLPHAILLSGEFSDLDMKIARAFICTSDNKPCLVCKACMNVASCADVSILDVEDKLITVDMVRNIVKSCYIAPLEFQNKVYIIRNAENMNENASNALLKTLEEPPLSTKFILTTKNTDKLLSTIISRCSVFHFNEIINEEENEPANTLIKALYEKNELDILSLKFKDKTELRQTIIFAKYLIRNALLDRGSKVSTELKRIKGDRYILKIYNILVDIEEKLDYNINIQNLLYYFVLQAF